MLRKVESAGFAPRLVLAFAALAASFAGPSCREARPQRTPRAEAAPVLVAQAIREDVPLRLTGIGTVEPYRTVAVRARIGGALTRVHFREGDEVQSGAALFTIDPRPYQVALKAAEANLGEEQARLATAVLNARRSAQLLEQKLVSPQDHERVAAAAAAESAAVLAREANVETARLNLSFCSLTAPISGRTSNLLLHEGNLVTANDDRALVVINQLSPISVAFSVPQRRLPEVLQYMGGEDLEMDASPPESSGEPSRGRLTFVNNTVDSATGTVLLKGEFPNADRKLWPGEFVRVNLRLTTRRGALVIPGSAVQSGQKGDYVLVVKRDQTAEMRPVTVGLRQEELAIVEAGLEEGETVVTDGQIRVVPGGRVAVKTALEEPGRNAESGRPAPGGPSASADRPAPGPSSR